MKDRFKEPFGVLKVPSSSSPSSSSYNPTKTHIHFGSSAGGAGLQVFLVQGGRVHAWNLATGQKVLEDDCSTSSVQSTGSPLPPMRKLDPSTTMMPHGKLAVATPEAVYFYTADEGRTSAFALPGRKHILISVGKYMAVSLPSEEDGQSNRLTVNVYDLDNKVIAASIGSLEAPIAWAASSSSSISAAAPKDSSFLTLADAQGTVLRLTEKSLAERLEPLYKARAFGLALSLAARDGADSETLSNVHRQYGDFLYSKRDYDQAVEQYCSTIGSLEPSFVIQKFLDLQRLPALTKYLEALHTAGAAGEEHTTLLLNAYTKLRSVDKLDAFIKGNEGEKEGTGVMALPTGMAAAEFMKAPPHGTQSSSPPPYDTAAAIRVLRSAGYYQHALYVALHSKDVFAYLEILLEGCQLWDDGIAFARGLSRPDAASALKKHGRVLLQYVPVETTALLMELCLPSQHYQYGVAEQKRGGGGGGQEEVGNFVCDLADFAHLYADKPQDLKYACITILNMTPPSSSTASPSRSALYHTLLDLYLQQESKGLEALDLLKKGWILGEEANYDVERAMITCRMHSYRPGLLFLLERRGLYRESASLLAEAKDWQGVLDICERYGDPNAGGDPALWMDSLEYFAAVQVFQSPEEEDEVVGYTKLLLDKIEAGNILPPLLVMQTLSSSRHFTLGLVGGYIERVLAKECQAAQEFTEEGNALKEGIEKTRAEIEKLQTEPVVFQSSRDSQTQAPLELPSVHFFCGHSYNMRTLGDVDDPQCPLCAPSHKQVKDLKRSHAASATDKDAFFRQLRASGDGFGLVAEFFGKGLLNRTSVTLNRDK